MKEDSSVMLFLFPHSSEAVQQPQHLVTQGNGVTFEDRRDTTIRYQESTMVV